MPWNVRFPTMANHTATHLLHEALRTVLGDHVHQAGSQVRPDKLRFDFSHPQALTAEERGAVERRVNESVFENHPVRTYIVPKGEAEKLGAMMLFGEKYGDEVRVVEVDGVSRELCGGTHVRSTAEIGPFVILSEGSVGSGARRIEAVTAGEAFALLRGARREADELRAELERARKEAKRPARQASSRLRDPRRARATSSSSRRGRDGRRPPRPLRPESGSRKGQRQSLLGSTDDGSAFLVCQSRPGARRQGVDAVELVRERGRTSRAEEEAGRRSPRQAGRSRRRSARRSTEAREAAAARKLVKVLALDYGSARTGVAVSDPSGMLAGRSAWWSGRRREAGLARLARAGPRKRAPSGSSSVSR